MSNLSEVTPSTGPRPLRSDAARNHRAVLAAARALYAHGGLGVGFDEIARRAGVGVGTVYRRFPDRRALLSALFEERLLAVNALARRALKTEDAWSGLEQFIIGSVEMFSEDRGLWEIAFDPASRYEGLADTRKMMVALVTAVTERAHHAGVLRDDCRPQDVASIIAMLSQIARPPGGGAAWASDGSAARCTDFLLAGLRPPQDTPP